MTVMVTATRDMNTTKLRKPSRSRLNTIWSPFPKTQPTPSNAFLSRSSIPSRLYLHNTLTLPYYNRFHANLVSGATLLVPMNFLVLHMQLPYGKPQLQFIVEVVGTWVPPILFETKNSLVAACHVICHTGAADHVPCKLDGCKNLLCYGLVMASHATERAESHSGSSEYLCSLSQGPIPKIWMRNRLKGSPASQYETMTWL